MKFLAVLMLLSQVAFSQLSMTNTGNGGGPSGEGSGGGHHRNDGFDPTKGEGQRPSPGVESGRGRSQTTTVYYDLIENSGFAPFDYGDRPANLYSRNEQQVRFLSSAMNDKILNDAVNLSGDYYTDMTMWNWNADDLAQVKETGREVLRIETTKKAAYFRLNEFAIWSSNQATLLYNQGNIEEAEFLRTVGLRSWSVADANLSDIGLNTSHYSQASMGSWCVDFAKESAAFCFSMSPLGWIEDVYGALSGRNLWSNEELNNFEYGVAVLGAATVGYGSKAAKAAETFVKINRRFDAKFVKGIFDARPISEIKPIVGFFKQNKSTISRDAAYLKADKGFVDDWGFADVFTSFKNPKVEVLAKDEKFYRYYIPGMTNEKSLWLTNVVTTNPQRDLALPVKGAYVMKTWTIPKGTKVIRGEVASNFGQKGGNMQIFIPSVEILQ